MAAAIIVGYVLIELKLIPTGFENYVYGILWLIVSISVTQLIAMAIKSRLSSTVGSANASSVAFIVRLSGYVIAFVVFLAIIRVGVTEALAAGGFTGLVVGLASQFVLSNIFGGIVIILTRPFRVGDRITFSTWQYGLIVPSYPPKFFSTDYLVPGYTGVVEEINLMYTVILSDDNVPIKVPNSVMAQAAIFVHSGNEVRRVRTRYEVPKDLDPEVVIKRLEKELSALPIVADVPTIRVIESSQSTYVLAIDARCKTMFEDEARHSILITVMKTIKAIQEEQKGAKLSGQP
ncbi:mechanosensitive ion channel family protein [Acidilobus sp. 7A]|uniref:mechanosensitive ion channel family protein n=1 Tax=Acidilobus sp. 7A TaxID=1577685 RepID=UPI001F3A9BD1|nr:mechanosensitive ion channel family protein [Acidilobus sp. 7A]